ncbi:hypothetical protein PMAYCL1PPCAC_18674, partial [Pristionchus mayeri]
EEERMRREEEEEIMRREEEERLRREREARLEIERAIREAEERKKREEEEERNREKELLKRERIEKEEEEKRLRDEEEARREIERQLREEEERLRREDEERVERERKEEEERLKREEEARIEMEMRREEERRKDEEELREWGAKHRKAHDQEELIFQEMLAIQEREKKQEEIRMNQAARTIQSSMRQWLHKKRVEKRTVELLQRMDSTPRNGKERTTFGGFSDDRLIAGVREIKRRQRKLSLTLFRMNRLSNGQAATRIQAWWRGILSRRNHRMQVELIRVRMREFNEKAEKAMPGDTEERAIPVSRRLERAKQALENPLRLYDIKVACYTTMSLCRLSSLYCERAIVLDIPSLLVHTFTVQADRSPAFEEIIEFGVQAVEEMVKCSTVRVREDMVAQKGEVVALAAHQMLAFQSNKVIAPAAMRIIRMYKDILPVESHGEIFDKIHSYYLKKGEGKFCKLPINDTRRKEFGELQKVFATPK